MIEIDEVIISAAGMGDLEGAVGARVGPCGDLVSEVLRQTESMLVRAPRERPFGGYLAVAEDEVVVGTCGFRTGPSADGEVEIAYFTFPPYEGRGHATAMAAELARIACASGVVRRVVANTLQERNASTRVLEKLGMRFCGTAEDHEDGMVWRWELGCGPTTG